ncbi:MAG: hypothetical protein JWO98_4716 [Frankiales bacterium]|nr:hypothetical protein [Frankiales bacterium]
MRYGGQAEPLVSFPPPVRPAAPDTTGELREALVSALFPYMHADDRTESRDPALAAWLANVQANRATDAVLALPALRDLLAERDTLAAKVEAVEDVAEDYEGYVADRGRPAPGSYDHGLNMAQKAAAVDLRRALGTPTTGGGE